MPMLITVPTVYAITKKLVFLDITLWLAMDYVMMKPTFLTATMMVEIVVDTILTQSIAKNANACIKRFALLD